MNSQIKYQKKDIGNNYQMSSSELIEDDKIDELFEGLAKPRISKCRLPNVFLNSKKKLGKQQLKQKKQYEIKTDKITRKNPMQNIQVKAPQIKKKQSQKGNKNPLIPIKNSIKFFEQFKEDLDSANQLLQKFQKYKFSSYRIPSQIKIQQCLTLNYVRKLKNNGCVKKILHIPTFKIYYLQQQPINLKDDKIIIKEWVENWEKCPVNDHQLKTYGLYWNIPQGFLSLIYEYPEYKTLKDLLQSSEFLPENVLRKIVKDLISGLDFLEKNGIHYTNIQQNEFLFDQRCKLKFYPNLELDSKNHPSNSENTIINKFFNISNQIQSQSQKIIAKIGFMCFRLALGSFIMQQELLEIIQTILEKQNINQDCCILHALKKYEESVPLYKKYKSKWAPEFIDFLCGCLKFDQKKRVTMQILKNHKFLLQIDLINKVELIDLIYLTKQQPSVSEDVVKGSQARLNSVLEAIELILATAQNSTSISIKKDSTAIKCISQQTGLDSELVLKHISKVYQISNTK